MASALLTGSTTLLVVQYDKSTHFFDPTKDVFVEEWIAFYKTLEKLGIFQTGQR